ncbi:MAG: hypothetical protein JNIBNLAF_00578 [Nitrosomonas europaea]|nr:MAG: hypothetical protein UZ02_AOB001001385 [Nitrosomonas europaea]MBV6388982.1 hypothetical protein [Nitrosomonas europaea]
MLSRVGVARLSLMNVPMPYTIVSLPRRMFCSCPDCGNPGLNKRAEL